MIRAWWRRLSASPVFQSPRNLLGPDILCEVVIHVMPDWTRHIYVSKLDTTPDVLAKIVESIVRSGVDLGAQHGIKIEFRPQEQRKVG